MIVLVFCTVTPCGFVVDTNGSEKHTVSIFRALLSTRPTPTHKLADTRIKSKLRFNIIYFIISKTTEIAESSFKLK
jgi:hypothetical protein